MRAVLAMLLGLLLAAGCCAHVGHTEHADPPRVSADELADATVALVDVPLLSGELRAYCSGVWISATDILTAAHCAPTERVQYLAHEDLFVQRGVYLEPPAFARTRVALRVRVDERHDLALLRVDPRTAPILHGGATRHKGNVAAGTSCAAMGHSVGLWFSYSRGSVSAYRMHDFDDGAGAQLWLQASTAISPGNSGGGLFDDAGHLLGIASRTFSRGQIINMFVPAASIEAFLDAKADAGTDS